MSEYYIQPYDWKSVDIDDELLQIKIWGHDNNSNRVVVYINDYKPFCRIQLPTRTIKGKDKDGFDEQDLTWNNDLVEIFMKWITKIMGDNAPIDHEFKMYQNLYNYNGDKRHPYLTLTFNSLNAVRHCGNLFNKKEWLIYGIGYIKPIIREKDISIIHQFITKLDVGYGQWLKVVGDVVDNSERRTFKTFEIEVGWENIQPLDENICKGWMVNPVVASIDIECYSSNHKSMPNKSHISDCVTMISWISQRLKDDSTRRRVLLALKGCDDIPGAEVRVFNDEIDMLKELGNLILEDDPTIITGYNINKFDLPYIKERFDIYREDLPNCSCLIDGESRITSSSWKSSAYGNIQISNIEAEGRITIDMYTIIQRDYGNKLERRTLDYVSKHFLKRGKHDVSAQEMFTIYKKLIDDIRENRPLDNILKEQAKVGAYCLEDSVLCIDLMKKLNTFIGLVEMCSIVNVTMFEIFSRGQQLRVLNQVYRECSKLNIVIDDCGEINNNFEGGYVVPPIPGKYQYILILDFASLYPSIIIAYNICYTTLLKPDDPTPDEQCNVIEWESDGVVHKYRFIRKEIYEGLLPRMCQNLILNRKKVRAQINPDNDPTTNIILDQRQLALKVSANSIFGALGVRNGKLPLPEGAASITAKGRLLNHECQKYVIDNTPNGKTVYGDTDSIMVDLQIQDPHECKIYGEKLSEGITQHLNLKPLSIEFERSLSTALFIGKKYYAGYPLDFYNKDDKKQKIKSIELMGNVYEMTGTSYYKMTIYDKAKNIEYDKYIGIKDGVDLNKYDFYAGFEVNKNGMIIDGKILKKGIVIARRDRCKWVRSVYYKVLTNILFDKPISYVQDILNTEIIKLLNYRIPTDESPLTKDELSLDDLIVSAEVGVYKPKSSYRMKIFKDEMLKKGQPLEQGERIVTVMVSSSDPDKNVHQGHKMRLPEHYMLNRYEEPLDKVFYLFNSLMKPIHVLIKLGYTEYVNKQVLLHKYKMLLELMLTNEKLIKENKDYFNYWNILIGKVREVIETKNFDNVPDHIKNNLETLIEKYAKNTKNKIYTYNVGEYIKTWVDLINYKNNLNKYINTNKPHFKSQQEYLLQSFN